MKSRKLTVWSNSEEISPGDKLDPNRSGKFESRLPLYGPLDVDNIQRHLKKSKLRFIASYKEPCPFVVSRDEFEMISMLGQGAFGQVHLVKQKKDQNFYAMKAMEKKHIVETKQVAHALNEKRILQCLDYPFMVRLELFAQDLGYIFLFMPFISGGEMFLHLQKMGNFSESTSIFYASQVVLGLEYLHYLGLVFRDLKPENLLLDHTGYLKITDFGFAKHVVTRTYTFCGTPHYLAPEVITGHGYGHSVDWWSLGVLIFEMNIGYPPFNADDQMALFKLILKNEYVMPKKFNSTLRDIIQKLMQVDVTVRIGNLRGRAEDVKKQEWFSSVNWTAMFNRKVPAPFIPEVSGSGDVSQFETKPCSLKEYDKDEFEDAFKEF